MAAVLGIAGDLVQGAVFTVTVVRAGLERDPAYEQARGAAGNR